MRDSAGCGNSRCGDLCEIVSAYIVISGVAVW